MNHKVKYDVFISYRRQGGYETALPIVEKLRSAGYRVFFDIESMNSGKFNEQLINVIKNCTDFVLVLPKDGLDRCQDPTDWVRREVECAMEAGKNIIPVILRGYAWPEDLPQSIAELPNYQGVSATMPEHFDLAVERLKGYLKSRPHRPWHRWAGYTLSAVACIALLSLAGWFAFRQMAKPVAQEAATRLTYAMAVIHSMYEVNENFNREWDAYVSIRNNASASRKADLDREFLEMIESTYAPQIRSLADTYPDFSTLSSLDRKLLGYYGIDAADIDGLPSIVAGHIDEFVDHFDICSEVIQEQLVNDNVQKNFQLLREAREHGRNQLYYLYWAELSKLPQEVRTSHATAVKSWHLYPTVSERLTPTEYEQMAELESRRADKAMVSVEVLLGMLGNHVYQLEEYLNELEKE